MLICRTYRDEISQYSWGSRPFTVAIIMVSYRKSIILYLLRWLHGIELWGPKTVQLNYFLPGLPQVATQQKFKKRAVGRNSIPKMMGLGKGNSLEKWQFLIPMLDFRGVAAKKESRLVWHPTTVDVPKSCTTWDAQKAADNGRFYIFFLGKQRFLLPINNSMSRFHEPSIFSKKNEQWSKPLWHLRDPYNGLL